jgi:dUTPase
MENEMTILCELMDYGIVPVRKHADDGGYDLFLPEYLIFQHHEFIHRIGLKIKLLLPIGWTGRIVPRSSAYNEIDVNGTIDRYTGEIHLTVKRTGGDFDRILSFGKGVSIAQIIPVFTGAGLKPMDKDSFIPVNRARKHKIR